MCGESEFCVRCGRVFEIIDLTCTDELPSIVVVGQLSIWDTDQTECDGMQLGSGTWMLDPKVRGQSSGV